MLQKPRLAKRGSA